VDDVSRLEGPRPWRSRPLLAAGLTASLALHFGLLATPWPAFDLPTAATGRMLAVKLVEPRRAPPAGTADPVEPDPVPPRAAEPIRDTSREPLTKTPEPQPPVSPARRPQGVKNTVAEPEPTPRAPPEPEDFNQAPDEPQSAPKPAPRPRTATATRAHDRLPAEPDHTSPARDDGPDQAVLAYLNAELSRHFSYPLLARRRGWQGKVVLEFRVEVDGRIDRIQVARSSGYPMLDRSAVAALGKVGRVGRNLLGNTHLDMLLPVHYQLVDG
jgi:protein TonB